jgi:hypothetical protein
MIHNSTKNNAIKSISYNKPLKDEKKEQIEELIMKMETLKNSFIILGLIIDSTYYHSNGLNSIIDKRKLNDGMYSLKTRSFIYIVIIYDLFSYLHAEMMFLKFNKGSLYTLRLDSNNEAYCLYCRVSNEKPYCDQFYSNKFPAYLRSSDSNIFNRFHNVYDELEILHKDIKDIFLNFLAQQKYDGNNVVLKLSPMNIYELFNCDENIYIHNMLRKLSDIVIPFYSVIRFINDFKVAEKINKKVVVNTSNELLKNYTYTITYFQKKYKKKLRMEDLSCDLFSLLNKDELYKVLRKDIEIVLKKISYDYMVKSISLLIVSTF